MRYFGFKVTNLSIVLCLFGRVSFWIQLVSYIYRKKRLEGKYIYLEFNFYQTNLFPLHFLLLSTLCTGGGWPQTSRGTRPPSPTWWPSSWGSGSRSGTGGWPSWTSSTPWYLLQTRTRHLLPTVSGKIARHAHQQVWNEESARQVEIRL